MLSLSLVAKRALLFLSGILVIVSLSACKKDVDSVVLDFQSVSKESFSSKEDPSHLNVAVSAMTSPQETYNYYQRLLGFIAVKTGREIQLKQRKTYKEINDLLLTGELDMAFICSGAYVDSTVAGRIRLLAVPQINGKTTYQSYLIVPNNSKYKSISDLRGLPFAFTDPLSLTGCSFPKYSLLNTGSSYNSFFSTVIYTHGHDNSIKAVSRGMVQGANIDGLIHDYLAVHNPHMIQGVKVIDRSTPFGIPPVVVPVDINPELERQLLEVLTTMHIDSTGNDILEHLMIDRFATAHDSIYNSVRTLLNKING